jgi:hypothetical protein
MEAQNRSYIARLARCLEGLKDSAHRDTGDYQHDKRGDQYHPGVLFDEFDHDNMLWRWCVNHISTNDI